MDYSSYSFNRYNPASVPLYTHGSTPVPPPLPPPPTYSYLNPLNRGFTDTQNETIIQNLKLLLATHADVAKCVSIMSSNNLETTKLIHEIKTDYDIFKKDIHERIEKIEKKQTVLTRNINRNSRQIKSIGKNKKKVLNDHIENAHPTSMFEKLYPYDMSAVTDKKPPLINSKTIIDGLLPVMNIMNLPGEKKKPQVVANELNDDDEKYDGDANIIADDCVTDESNNLVELETIETIDDIIRIGEKYKEKVIENEKAIKIHDVKPLSDLERLYKALGLKEFKIYPLVMENQPVVIKKEILTDDKNDKCDCDDETLHDKPIEPIIKNTDNKELKEFIIYDIESKGLEPDGEISEIKPLDEEKKTDPKDKYEYYELDGKRYSVDLGKVVKLVEPLKMLKRMIGINKIKDSVFEMILYFLQGFEKTNGNMLHTVIEGPPGVGKTKFGKIITRIYSALGIISSTRFKLVKRTDLVGRFLGETAIKTQQAIDEAEGGVLFIDEAYALGFGNDSRDSFSKECIDTLNQNLSEKKKNLIVIIAGYPDQLDECFFAQNEGLKRRFPFRFKIEGYNPSEMKDIFHDQIRKLGWKISKDLNESYLINFFEKNKDKFANFGGDIETLVLNCKFAHSKRVVGKHPQLRTIITQKDFDNAFKKFDLNKKEKDKSTEYLKMFM